VSIQLTSFDTYRLSDPTYNIVFEVSKAIREENNFQKAAQIAVQNNLSIRTIMDKTCKLNLFDIAKLADAMKALKT
jgi:hypothetical protein